jgi:hypothetical protein
MDNVTNRQHIGREEAFEIMLERGIEKLPRKGKEVWTVYAIGTGKKADILGKDEQGYYTAQA